MIDHEADKTVASAFTDEDEAEEFAKSHTKYCSRRRENNYGKGAWVEEVEEEEEGRGGRKQRLREKDKREEGERRHSRVGVERRSVYIESTRYIYIYTERERER